MLGFGPMGSEAGGNSSLSTSNLSALAPPFTVDKLNPKPISNPNLHYSDSPYTAESYNHVWPFTSPSVSIPEQVFDSTGITSVPLSDDYRTISPTSIHWSALNSSNNPSSSGFSYSGGEVNPYYSPYVPPLAGGENSQLVEDEGSPYNVRPGPRVISEIDYTSSLWDVDYEAPWVDNLGFDAGKRAKRVEEHSYGNQSSIGVFCTENNKNKSPRDSGVSYQKSNQSSDIKLHIGTTTAAKMEDKSCHEQNFGLSPYNSTNTHAQPYISTYFEPYHSIPSSDMHKCYSYDQNSYEQCVKPIDKPFTGPVSAIMSSPTVSIRPPPATNDKYGPTTFYRNPARSDNVESVNFGPKSNSQITEDALETNLFTSTPVQELPFIFDRKDKAKFETQLSEINIFGAFNTACDDDNNNNIRVVNSVENCSDHQSTAVDSPCWKGASSSRFSVSDTEYADPNHMKKNPKEFYQAFKSVIDPSRAFLERTGENFERNEYDRICPSKKHSLSVDAKGIETSNEPIILVNDLISEGVKMNMNDISEGAVAVHAAENVLASPGSQEDDDTERRTVIEDRKLNVRTMLKAMRNISELLLFRVSSGDACFMEEENTETIENIISNLRACLDNKIIEASKKGGPKNHVEYTCDKLRADGGTTLRSSRTGNKAPDSCIKQNCQHMHCGDISYSLSGKKDEKSPFFSPSGDDLNIRNDDNMTKAIKKVLVENFHLNEEMNLQTLVFKNLWLDAEAKLCSVTYKARFDRMRIQMEHLKTKAPRDTEQIMSQVCVSPDPKGRIPKPALQDISISSTSRPTDGIEASVMSRFNILKSREANVKPIDIEDEQQKAKTVDVDERVDSVTARLGILKLRTENSPKLFSDNSIGPCTMGRSEDETLNVCRKMAQSGGCPDGGEFCSYLRGDEYEASDEFNLSVANDPIVHSFMNSLMIDQRKLGRRDSSNSDWEHVLKDDFPWKDL